MILRATALLLAMSIQAAAAQDLMVSANDGKYVRKDGVVTYPQPSAPDSVALIDVSAKPPKIITVIEGVAQSVSGPPQAVAITPDRRLILIGSPDHLDAATGKTVADKFLQVIDLKNPAPQKATRIDMAGTPQGLSVSPDGKLLLAACLDGNVAVFKIDGGTVTFAKTVAVSTGRLSGVTFTHDGAHALVGMRDEGGLAVLDISNGAVTMSNQRITTGYTPYAIDISGDGKWAVVSAVGPPARPGLSRTADADIVTLVDVSKSPFRAAQHLSVPPVPESVAISPDGKWIAVLSMDGSSYAPTNPARTKTGKVALFAIRNGHATQVDEKPSGVAGQGIVFAADSKTIVVQMNPEKALGIFAVQNGRLVDTKQRLQLNAGPTSLRTLPR